MPKTFSEQERSIIKKSMYSITSVLIRKKGLRQVTVEDVTKEANIAKGSFYSFYNRCLFIEGFHCILSSTGRY